MTSFDQSLQGVVEIHLSEGNFHVLEEKKGNGKTKVQGGEKKGTKWQRGMRI